MDGQVEYPDGTEATVSQVNTLHTYFVYQEELQHS